MKRSFSYLGTFAIAALWSLVVASAGGSTPALAAMTSPNLQSLGGSSVTLAHCRAVRHCHRRCTGPSWNRTCRRRCHSC